MFKKLGKHWLGSLHLKHVCGASLSARELKKEKDIERSENLSPKHCLNRETSTNKIHVSRFGRGLKVASLKS